MARQPRHGPNYTQLLHLLNDLQNHQSAWPFVHPVNKDEVADYYEVIKNPMDLSTMEDKHERDQYPTPEDFIRDAKLIFDNCRKYNNETTPYAKSANRLEKFMWQQIRAIPEWSVGFILLYLLSSFLWFSLGVVLLNSCLCGLYTASGRVTAHSPTCLPSFS